MNTAAALPNLTHEHIRRTPVRRLEEREARWTRGEQESRQLEVYLERPPRVIRNGKGADDRAKSRTAQAEIGVA